MSVFDAVLFDLDGTLCDRSQDTEAMWEAAFERVGEAPFATPSELWAALDGPPDHDDWVGYIGAGVARLAAQHGRTDVEPLALATALEAIVDDTAVTAVPGTLEALDAAAERGPIGIVTNGPRASQKTKLDALGIGDRFDTVTYGAELPRKKPHAAPFERALSELDVAPARALYVGNSLEYDVAGAQNAGLDVAWLRRSDEDVGAYEPEYVIDSLAALPQLLVDVERSDRRPTV